MIEGLQLRHHSADDAKEIHDQLVDLYLEVYTGGGEFYSEDRYRRQLDLHMQHAGWKLVTATVSGKLIGYIYGFPLQRQTRWWEGIQQPVPPGFTAEDGERTFAVSELLVHPSRRRHGVATRLHQEIVRTRRESRITLLVRPDNKPARALYHSLSWNVITTLQPGWKEAPRFEVMIYNPASITPGNHV